MPWIFAVVSIQRR